MRNIHVPKTNAAFASPGGLVEAMLRRDFYPRPPDEIIHKETHISHVFLVGDSAYKIKKPVRFSFLDFSTLARRRNSLQEELRQNRRLAPSVYLAVLPISCDCGHWRLGGWSEPVEYTLLMRRLPEKRMLKFLLHTQQMTAVMMEQLADHLADFHRAAEVVRGLAEVDYLAMLRAQWNDNLSAMKSLMSCPADSRTLETIDAFGSGFLKTNRELLGRRLQEGWIRDVHGDLHTDHVCFAPEGIQIFDCIEFDARLRRCDLASEIAFLLMDVAINGGEPLLGPFVTRYRERLKDEDLTRLLPYFQCYRAMVRAKVHALRLGCWNNEAARYLHYARRMIWEPFKPFLLLICGLPGSGKSTLARPMGERLGVIVINSDVVRKQIAAKPGRHVVGYHEGIYHPMMTEKTYAAMACQAEEEILRGEGAVVDASFAQRDHREKFIALAEKYRIPLVVIYCSVSEATTESRLGLRTARGNDVSDADWSVYLAQKAAYQPLDELPPSCLIRLDTDRPRERLIDETEALLRIRLTSY